MWTRSPVVKLPSVRSKVIVSAQKYILFTHFPFLSLLLVSNTNSIFVHIPHIGDDPRVVELRHPCGLDQARDTYPIEPSTAPMCSLEHDCSTKKRAIFSGVKMCERDAPYLELNANRKNWSVVSRLSNLSVLSSKSGAYGKSHWTHP